MIAKQSVYLNGDRDKALPDGHVDARFMLVRAGQEIAEADLDKYEGASDLANSDPPEREVVPIPPPTLKQHGQSEENPRTVPDPNLKAEDGGKQKAPPASAPADGKVKPPVKQPKAKRGPKPKK